MIVLIGDNFLLASLILLFDCMNIKLIDACNFRINIGSMYILHARDLQQERQLSFPPCAWRQDGGVQALAKRAV